MCRTPGSKSAGRKVVLGSCTQVEGPFLAPCRAARLAQAARGPLRQPEPQLREPSSLPEPLRGARAEPGESESSEKTQTPHDGWVRRLSSEMQDTLASFHLYTDRLKGLQSISTGQASSNCRSSGSEGRGGGGVGMDVGLNCHSSRNRSACTMQPDLVESKQSFLIKVSS